jgi:anti-sigma factor RsiW
MPCAEANRRLPAYFDGELDALAAADMERHLAGCAGCRASLEELTELRAALRSELNFRPTPPELKARIAAALDREGAQGRESAQARGTSGPADDAPDARVLPFTPRPAVRGARPFWAGAFAGVGAAALAASLAFFLLVPAGVNPLLDELVNAHVRSLMPAHLIDVESTDRHTVKPWFAGHVDVSPVVADFTDRGYKLIGGRADYFAHQRAAAVVYRHGAHIINVFSWSQDGKRLPADTSRNGYHLAFWRAGNLDYCAVSDTGWDELRALERLLNTE